VSEGPAPARRERDEDVGETGVRDKTFCGEVGKKTGVCVSILKRIGNHLQFPYVSLCASSSPRWHRELRKTR